MRDESMGRSHQISDATIQKMEGFMQNPYSAEFPGIDVNQSGDGWAAAIMRSMPIPTGSIIISRTVLSAILIISVYRAVRKRLLIM